MSDGPLVARLPRLCSEAHHVLTKERRLASRPNAKNMQRRDLRPRLLEAENFTPLRRTPWGGEAIARLKGLHRGADGSGPILVGESWEISIEPDFPSRLEGGDLLSEFLAADAEAWLGGREASLLVKLLDAQDDLSLQIHPSDDDPALAEDEGGKPEAWYIVEHAPGAGVYFGLSDEATPHSIERALRGEGDLRQLLRFHPVRRGDFFLVEPGVPHAVGAGVFLVEPQRVLKGKRGITYRYYDWGRRYDEEGRPSAEGKPRALHAERALSVTDFERPRGPAFDEQTKRRLGEAELSVPLRAEVLAGASGGLPSEHLYVARLAGSGSAMIEKPPLLTGVTVVRGELELEGITIPSGRSAILPATLAHVRARGAQAEAILSASF